MITPRQALLYCLSFIAILSLLLAARANLHRVPVLKQIEFRTQTEDFITRLNQTLNEAEGCEPALAGQHIVASQSQSVLLIDPPMRSGLEVEKGMILEDISLAAGAADMKVQMKDLNGTLTRYPASLRLRLRSSDGKIRVNWQKTGDVELGIKLYVWADSTGKIISCFSPNSAAAFCNATNGFYLHQECRPTLRILSPLASDSPTEPGSGTCRYSGFQPHCPRGQISQSSCATGKCLATQELCQICE